MSSTYTCGIRITNSLPARLSRTWSFWSSSAVDNVLRFCWCGKPAVSWELAVTKTHPLCEDHCTQREIKVVRQPNFGPPPPQLDVSHFTHVEIRPEKDKYGGKPK